MNKYQLVLRCKNWRCDHSRRPFKTIVYAENEAELKHVPDPPCPKCEKKLKRTESELKPQAAIPITPLEQWVQDKQAPGIIGRNNTVKAIDMAAQIAMEDYKLTDLKDNVRQGDVMAPRLPVPLQKAADNFFNPAANTSLDKKRRAQLQRMGQKAIAGGYRHNAVDVKSVLPDSRVALRSLNHKPG